MKTPQNAPTPTPPTDPAIASILAEDDRTIEEFEAIWNGEIAPNLRKCAFFVYWHDVVRQSCFTAYCAAKADR